MLAQIKRLTKHSIVYGISNILGRTLNFLLLPLYTNFLPPQEFGYFSVLYAYIGVTFVILLYGMDSAFLRFYLLEKDHQRQKIILSNAFLVLSISTAVMVVAMFLSAGSLNQIIFKEYDGTKLIRWAIGILFFDAMSALGYMLLRAEEKSLTFALIRFGNILVTIGITVLLFVGFQWGIEAVFISNCVASAVGFLVLLPHLWRKFIFHWDWGVVKELFQFGIPFMPSALSVTLIEISDRILIQHFTDTATVGIYNSGHTLSRLMSVYVGMFLFAWQPFFLQISGEPDAKKIYARVLTYFTFIAGIIYLGLLFFVDDLIRFKIPGTSGTLIGEKFWEGTKVIPLVALGYICYGWYVNLLPGIQIEKKTSVLPYITGLGAGMNILTNIICIPLWGMQGAALATFLAYGAMAVSLFVVTRKIYPVSYEWKRLGLLIGLFGSLTLVGKLWWDYTELQVGLLIFIPLFLMLLGFFNKGEWNLIKTITNFKRIVSP